MVPVANRSSLQAALESSRGTVTHFLEQLVGEPIDAQPLHQDMVRAAASNDLGVAEGEPLRQRAATLRGRITGSSYVYAESVIVTSRLPTRFCLRLESSIDPIGRILDEMGIAVTREKLVKPHGFDVSRPNEAMKVGDCLLARTYRIDSEQTPLMIITEWFLRTLKPFLSSA
jgi:chorismate--pyruvate lyase